MSGRLSLLELSPSLRGNGALLGGTDASSAAGGVGLLVGAGLPVGAGESGSFEAGFVAGVGASGTLPDFAVGVGASGALFDFAAELSPGKVVSVLRFGS